MMRKFLVLAALLAVTGCASLQQMVSGPPAATAPATPVFFQPLSATLDQPALTAIAAAAQAAMNAPDAKVTVVGAADTVGTTQANITLSKARAEAVAAQLTADGVAAGRIHNYGIGETGRSDNTAQANRRALITIGG